jgi:hypothetical protein
MRQVLGGNVDFIGTAGVRVIVVAVDFAPDHKDLENLSAFKGKVSRGVVNEKLYSSDLRPSAATNVM